MKRVLITGAGGFIGGRLVEILKTTSNPEINILLRNIIKAARVSCFPLNYFSGNVTDEESIKVAMDGCDTVVHCAHDFGNPKANLKAADIIARQCIQYEIKKLVYISSFGVHQANAGKIINEQSSLNEHWEYASNKFDVEKKLIEYYHQSGLPVVILRPTIVYGPFSTAWTTSTVMQMRENRVVIPFQGNRICNAVYIDDVIGAIIKAIDTGKDCNGKSYIVSGPDAITWKTYYNSFLSYSSLHEPLYMNDTDSDNLQKAFTAATTYKTKPSLLKDPITVLKKTPVYTLYRSLLKRPAFQKGLLSAKSSIPRPLLHPTKESFEILSCTGKADISKLNNELGYRPEVPFSEGMKKTLAWLEWANLSY